MYTSSFGPGSSFCVRCRLIETVAKRRPSGEATANWCTRTCSRCGHRPCRTPSGSGERHGRRVVAWPVGFGGASWDEQVLLLLPHLIAVQLTIHISADEVVEVFRRRDDPARCPGPLGIGDVGEVLVLAFAVDLVAVDVRLRQLGAGRQRRVVQAQWFEHLLRQHVGVALTRRRLDHQADDDVVGVGVVVFRTGRELERLISDEGHELGRRQRLFERCEHRIKEHLETGEVRQPARMAEELAESDVAPRVRQLGKALGDRVVERHHSFVDQGQHRRPAEGFGHAGDAHVVPERGRLVGASSATPAVWTVRSEPRCATTIALGGPPGIATSSSTAWSSSSSGSSSLSLAVVSLQAANIGAVTARVTSKTERTTRRHGGHHRRSRPLRRVNRRSRRHDALTRRPRLP